MKRVLIPLFMHAPNGCCICQSGHSFRADWCLDLHGYLSREEFAARIDQINNHVKDVELMSSKTKRVLYLTATFGLILLILIFSLLFLPYFGFFIGLILSSILYFFVKYIIEKDAAERAIRFTNLLNELFARYNENENPAVNWKFWWVTSFENYISGKDGRAFGNGHINVLNISYCFCLKIKLATLFVDNALIILEINDALSDLTANTVRVNITPEADLPTNTTHVINMKYD
ncbi:2830_t:CDS:1 [Dentiscutata erythropus]|uniref:2830_t:CDS:1 n=1 Tax=Dentiscutata erythropus TaxID=1348616 RepID=A0A9N9C2U5_9GLOM|nr:2830_t:CDS:1 [Dentiscutata erythropus]